MAKRQIFPPPKICLFFLFLDYDGTLTPLTNTPLKAIISSSMRNLLRKLAKAVKIAIVSGRAIKDNPLPLYIGDDTTDEDAFMALTGNGVTIYVGKAKTSSAQYYLKNTREVELCLRNISEFKTLALRK